MEAQIAVVVRARPDRAYKLAISDITEMNRLVHNCSYKLSARGKLDTVGVSRADFRFRIELRTSVSRDNGESISKTIHFFNRMSHNFIPVSVDVAKQLELNADLLTYREPCNGYEELRKSRPQMAYEYHLVDRDFINFSIVRIVLFLNNTHDIQI